MDDGAGETFSIESLPARGSIIVVHSAEVRARVRREVLDRYGSEVAGRTIVLAIRDRGDTGKIVGSKKPVFLDPAYPTSVNAETLAEVRKLAAGVNAKFRKPG
jgi:hypothetical protein